ncbi:signal peptidase I [Alysiella filiformis]|uniref:signal peptidase I n=1 Tax=Alysiella filiformis TaxID=194196 RepID=UPI000BE220E5|nr:signal peptidase I [Alysiella filiformis]QMT32471.1 signal peptidase I [Alysiella filiformis]UBQ57307.1 signal peptidase I [Alysiella filiformis DSM 16848]
MELNTIGYAAIGAIIVGIVMLFTGSKQRNSDGEWGSVLQWGYLLVMVGIFGVLSMILSWSFTAVLLSFTLFTGAVWAWAKIGKKDKNILDNNHFRDYMSGFFPIIAVVFVLRTFVAEPFQIPSSSMRPNLVKGDFILVNKFAYGIRIPVLNTVLIPTGTVQRGDVAVFNFPVDPKTNYIKRIVGVGGDVVEYKDKILTVNGQTEQDNLLDTHQYPDDTHPQTMREAQRFQAAFADKSFEVLKVADALSIEPQTFNAYQHELSARGFSNDWQQHCEFAQDGSAFRCKVPEGKYFAMGDNRDNSADSRYWGFVDDHLIVGKAFFIWMNFGNMGRIGKSIQ